ncbi:MAG: energy-coupling factor transporter ATPase [Bacilli bacterium]|nr:energy-coupling factor transporter ATPase [Bacilli bacterium]
MNIIEVQDLQFQYNQIDVALRNVSFSVQKGEFISILGHNGSGKSTLAKLLVGLLKPTSGVIKIDGQVLTEENVDFLRQTIGIVFQNPDNQFVGVTVKDDIAFGLENRKVPREQMLQQIERYATLVSMQNFMDHNPENLSGGEKQRVAIAGVLACEPEVIIFDEATSMLDPKGVREVLHVISNIKGNRTILSITHNLEEALLADRVMVMNEGKIVAMGTPKEVFKQKELLKDSKLDILESMKLIELVEQSKLNNKDTIQEHLWEFTYKK